MGVDPSYDIDVHSLKAREGRTKVLSIPKEKVDDVGRNHSAVDVPGKACKRRSAAQRVPKEGKGDKKVPENVRPNHERDERKHVIDRREVHEVHRFVDNVFTINEAEPDERVKHHEEEVFIF